MVGSVGANPVGSSCAPSHAASPSANSLAPLPHASQSTTLRADVAMRAVTGPVGISAVFQMAPSTTW
jgi:hypothetical protein